MVVTAEPSPRYGPPAFYDRRRTKEFYKYYEPIRTLLSAEPLWTDLHDDDAVARHRPVTSPDRALSAFCQLAAMKLNVQRGMIFLFNAERGYVLAEATQSMSLKDGAHLRQGDDLWLGHTTIPLGFSVCEHTVNLPANAGSNRYSDSADVAHIINDLSGDVRFCNRPYVTDGPRARYYAGVPITTNEGVNIGALCALDDKPHDGTSKADIELLVDLAAAIMEHLEALRAKAEFQRGNVMLASMTSFLEDINSLRDGDLSSDTLITKYAVHSPDRSRDTNDQTSSPGNIPEAETAPATEPLAHEVATQGKESTLKAVHTAAIDHRAVDSEAVGTVTTSRPVSAKINSSEEDSKNIYQHAAMTLRRAMNVDGVVFLTAPFTKIDTLNDVTDRSRDVSYPTSSGTNTAMEDIIVVPGTEPNKRSASAKTNLCDLLAAAYASSQGSPPDFRIRWDLLKALSRKWQYGKVWHLAQDDSMLEEPSNSSSSQMSDRQDGTAAFSTARPRSRIKDMSSFHKLIPGAQSVIFLPIWSHGSSKWSSGVVIYSTSPLRSFFGESDLQFVRAFCDVAVAELDRLDTKSLLRTKSTFVSSISHELRTPLHGILGTVECLRDQTLDSVTKGLVAQIESCGQTMLDIVNHILDYSHVNKIVQPPRSSSEDGSGARVISLEKPGGPMLSNPSILPHPSPKLALDRVSEDVIESAIHSFHFKHPNRRQSSKTVTSILDIDRGSLTEWSCKLSAGAWKRICINLVINALKYTADGYVHVTLRQEPPSTVDGDTKAVLTIADTGCGMSKDFMRTSLFKPFEQEDGVMDGMGLGMSLVVKILKTVKGHMNVKSIQGRGTTVTVSVPLTQKLKHPGHLSECSIAGGKKVPHDMVLVNFVGSSWTAGDTAYGKGRQILQASLRQSLNTILAQSFEHSELETSMQLDIVAEEDLPELYPVTTDRSREINISYPGSVSPKGRIVICKTHQSIHECKTILQAWDQRHQRMHVEYVVEPCGISQLATALQACLQAASSTLKLPFTEDSTEQSKQVLRPVLGRRQLSNRSSRSKSYRASASAQPPMLQAGSGDRVSTGRSDPTDKHGRESMERARGGAYTQDGQPLEVIPIPHKLPPTPALTPTLTYASDSIGVAVNVIVSAKTGGRGARSSSVSDVALLLVDDNEINMRLLTMYADRQRHGKLVAVNGLEAFQLYQKTLLADLAQRTNSSHRSEIATIDHSARTDTKGTDRNQPSDLALPSCWPQVILMDINMPIMDGFEATRRIRALEASTGTHRKAYIIAMTGLGSDVAQREALASGMDLFLTKPVRLRELTKIIESKPWTQV